MGWYDANSTYGAPQSYAGSPWQSTYFDTNPEAAYTTFGAANGIGQGDTPYERWFRSQFSRAQEGYGAALGKNPNMRFGDYLNGIDPATLQQQFASGSASARGLNLRSLAPSARWQNRG